MKAGDRVRYIGHTAKCTTCGRRTLPVKNLPLNIEGLDDQDEFGPETWFDRWDNRIGQTGVVSLNPSFETAYVMLGTEELSIYMTHLELLKEEVRHADQTGDL